MTWATSISSSWNKQPTADQDAQASATDSQNELISMIRETIVGKHGSIILASFGLGRAQELLKLIDPAERDAACRRCGCIWTA